MNRSVIDRDFPHHVALPAEASGGGDFIMVQLFCEGQRVCPRGYSFQREGRYYNVFCFKSADDADRFRVRFGGELIDPVNRPCWPSK